MKRIVLTSDELEAILTVAGDADSAETIRSTAESEAEARVLTRAFESGMNKLRDMLARKSSPDATGHAGGGEVGRVVGRSTTDTETE